MLGDNEGAHRVRTSTPPRSADLLSQAPACRQLLRLRARHALRGGRRRSRSCQRGWLQGVRGSIEYASVHPGRVPSVSPAGSPGAIDTFGRRSGSRPGSNADRTSLRPTARLGHRERLAAPEPSGQSVQMAAKRPKRDSGSRGLLGVLRHPIAAVTAPFRERAPATDEDRRAASGPEGRIVTCFVRASFDPLPRRWKQGGLQLDQGGARWAPGFRLRGGGSPLPSPVRVEFVREVTGSEGWRIKPGFFQVIEAATERGDLRLAVPRDSVALVVERLTSGDHA